MKTKLKKLIIVGAGKIASEYLKVLNKNNKIKVIDDFKSHRRVLKN